MNDSAKGFEVVSNSSETAASVRLRCVYDFRIRGSCVHSVSAYDTIDSAPVLVRSTLSSALGSSAVSYWYTRHVTMESSVRHIAAVDLERRGCEEKTWTTVRRKMEFLNEDTTTRRWYVVL